MDAQHCLSVLFRHKIPTLDPKVLFGPCERRFKLLRTISGSVASASFVSKCDRLSGNCPKTSVGIGIVQRGLFFYEHVAASIIIIEYMGIHIYRREAQDTMLRLTTLGCRPRCMPMGHPTKILSMPAGAAITSVMPIIPAPLNASCRRST